MSKHTFRLPPCMCPECGTVADMAGALLDDTGIHEGGDIRPELGAFTVCASCAAILRFESGLRMRSVTEEDFEGAPIEFVEAMARIVGLVKRMHKERGTELKNGSRPN